MGLVRSSFAMFEREMLIFKANIWTNLGRTFLMGVVYLLLFTFIGGASLSNIPVAVVNNANNAQSFQFINSLGLQQGLHVTQLSDQTSAMASLQTGDVSFVVVILPGFPDSTPAVHVYYVNTQSATTNFALSTIQQRAWALTVPGDVQSKLYLPLQTISATVTTTPVSGASGDYKDFVFPGIIAMIVAFSAIFNGITIITDRLGGNIKTFVVTPISKGAIVLGRIMASAVQSLVYITIILALGYLNGSSIAMGISGLPYVIALGVLIAVCFTSIAIIIASRTKDIQSCTIINQVAAIALWMLSGSVFSVLTLPTWLQGFSAIDPMTYASDGLRSVVLLGAYPTGSMIAQFFALGLFAIVSIAISIMLFKDTIE